MPLLAAAPTLRTAAILAVIAVAALLVPVWAVVAAAIALLAAAASDVWSVREPPAVKRALAPVLSRGVTVPISVEALARDSRRVLLRQPAIPALELDRETGVDEFAGAVVPRRRGRHELPGVASASVGPLGLARLNHPPGDALTVSVYPDLVTAHALIARLRRELAGHPGKLARGPLGLGTDFESIRDYTPDDDIRQLNWRATARMGRPMSNQYRVERDRDLVCVLDTGRLMAAPIGSRTMLDASLDAVAMLALAADELGDRCGAIAFDQAIRRFVAPSHRSGRQVIEALFDLEAAPVDSDFERAFQRVGRARRAFVAVFTDLVDEAAARSLVDAVPMLARRHVVVVVSALDPELERAAVTVPSTVLEAASGLVALDVLGARAAASATIARAGASVIEAGAGELAERCLRAYLDAKARARL
ncbi:MAG TPA: DUF58 domain-containing protein [Solirubrobacteraceae bacterium]|nr:DUF58 domain-containing protein [Solirubrobacteraceae bacterium]